jgi:hypothetical protein
MHHSVCSEDLQAGLHHVPKLESPRRGTARSRVIPAMGKCLALVMASGSLILLVAGCQVPGATSGSAATPNPCTAQAAHDVVDRFIDAFNRGDIAQLDQLFSAQQFDAYSTDAPGQRFNAEAQDRGTLMAYFSARHQQHEHLALISMDITYSDTRDVGFWFRVTRSADGLPPTRYNGKGGVQCATMPTSLVVWAMDPLPWSPIDLLPEAAALILLAAAIGAFVLRRRRTVRLLASSTKAKSTINR